MKSLFAKCLVLGIGALQIFGASPAFAIVVFTTEFYGEQLNDAFIIDRGDDVSGNLSLQFGNSLGENLLWDNANSRFTLSDDLRVEGDLTTTGGATMNGNVTLSGNQLINGRIENLASAPTCNAGARGRVYHNTTSNNSFVCNGSTFVQIDAAGGGDANTLDTIDSTQFLRSDTTDNYTAGTLTFDGGTTLTANAGNVNIDGINNTTFTIDEDNAATGVNVDIVANQGSEADGILRYNTTTNSWQLSNNGGGFNAVATTNQLHTQNTDTGTTANTFILDNDSTGGNVVLQFGATLAQTFGWDNANSRFTLSAPLRVSGNTTVVGQGFIAESDIATDSDGTLNLGRNSSAWETIAWNDAADQYNISDDINVTGGGTFSGGGSFGANVTLSGNQLLNGRIENLAAAPTCNAAARGRMYHNTVNNNSFVCNGTTFVQIDAAAATPDGWHGSQTRIKILPTDFISDDGDDNFITNGNGAQARASSGTTQVLASYAIPTGFQATALRVYGSDTANTVSTFVNDIANGTTATSLGTGTLAAEINITDTASTTTNYISVFVNLGNADQIYGGYITIAPE